MAHISIEVESTQIAARLASAALAVAIIVAPATNVEAQTSNVRFAPPPLDFARLCEVEQGAIEDPFGLKSWRSGDPNAPRDELLAMADLYRSGSSATPPDRELAKRLYEFISSTPARDAAKAKYQLAKLLLEDDAGEAQDARAAELLTAAATAPLGGAAEELAALYETGRGVDRDMEAALRFYRLAAVEKRPSAAFAIARLYQDGLVAAPGPDAAQQMAQLGMIELVTQANAGRCNALLSIARLYDGGRLVQSDQTIASAWYLAAAEGGEIRAMEEVADRFAGGIGVQIDMEVAIEWWAAAADLGSHEAAFSIGRVYSAGAGVPADGETALAWLERAADAGSVKAMQRLGELWSGALPTTPSVGADPGRAVEWYETALVNDPRRLGVLTPLARLYAGENGAAPNYARSLELNRLAAANGSVTALRRLAEALAAGRGTERDPIGALRFYRQAASRGDAGSFGELVRMHRCGVAGEPDFDAADRWLNRAAAQGAPRMMLELAEKRQSEGTEDALAERRMLLMRAAVGGSRKAMVVLAETYAAGVGVASDPQSVERWLALAIAPGEDQAEGLVALADAVGGDGPLAGSPERAAELLREAAALGDPSARIDYGRLLIAGAPGVPQDAAAGERMIESARKAGGEKDVSAALRALARLAEKRGDADDAERLLAQAAETGDMIAKLEMAILTRNERLLDQVIDSGPCRLSEIQLLAEALADGVAGDERRVEVFDWIDFANMAHPLDADDAARLGRTATLAAATPEHKAVALSLTRKAADEGSPRAMRSMSRFYEDGVFAEQNPALSLQWLKRAADAGDTEALVEMALAKSAGRFGPADPVGAARDLETAAERGSSRAMRELAKWYLTGLAGETDPERSVILLDRAAHAGDTAAMRELASLLTVGVAAEQDPEAALAWLLRAAEAGDAKAMQRLSIAYAAGFGAPVDPEAAARWMEAAAANGRPEARALRLAP